jgi:hypothetical protein
VTSKPAPFAEKKNAKDAAPENSIRDSIELRCYAKEFATRLLHRFAAWKSSGAVAEGMEEQSPSQPRAACTFSGWELSIDGDTGSGRCSFDLLYGSSDPDEIENGRPEFEIEGTFVGFSVGGDRIRFVLGEDV